MEEATLKQRLVGAMVLVSLAVIFIPMVLDGRSPSENFIEKSNIPPKPATDFVSRVIPLTPSSVPVPAEKSVEIPAEMEKQTEKSADTKQLVKTPSKPASKLTAATKPKAEPKVASKPKATAKTASKPKATAKTASKPKATAKTASKPKKPVSKPHTGLTAWAVQVGSFGSKKNAHALRDKLRGKGFAAFVDTVYIGDKPSYRLRVGPELKRELAEKLQAKLGRHIKGKTFIVKHP